MSALRGESLGRGFGMRFCISGGCASGSYGVFEDMIDNARWQFVLDSGIDPVGWVLLSSVDGPVDVLRGKSMNCCRDDGM